MKEPFGKTKDGKEVDIYTLKNKNGAIAKIMTYGALVTELHVPDKKGNSGDIVLGFDAIPTLWLLGRLLVLLEAL